MRPTALSVRRLLSISVFAAVCAPLPAVATEATEAADQALSGEWLSDCQPIGRDGRHGLLTRVALGPGSVQARATLYADPACTKPSAEARYEGALLEVRAEGDGRHAFEHRVTTISLTLTDTQVAAQYNARPDTVGCGLSDWQPGIARDISGRHCTAFRFAATGTVLHERAWLSGEPGKEQLHFGSLPLAWDADSAEKRAETPSPVAFRRARAAADAQ